MDLLARLRARTLATPPRSLPLWAVGVVYALLVAVMMRPLVLRLASGVPSDLGDSLLNTWILWWDSAHLPLTASWWNAPAFFPLTDVLAFSDHLLGLAWLTTPVIWLTGNPLLAHNLALLLSFVLCALSAYFLGLTLTGRRDLAFVVGLANGFAPYRMGQLAHVQVLAAFWVPLMLAGLHRFVATRGLPWLALVAVAVAVQGLTSGYYLMFLPVLVLAWVAWFVPLRARLATAAAIAAALLAALALQLPFVLRYAAVHHAEGFERELTETISYSSSLEDLLRCSADLALWGRWLGQRVPETGLFPGLTVLLVVVAGLVLTQRRASAVVEGDPILSARVRGAIAVLAGALSALAVHRALAGPVRVELLGLAVSTGSLPKVLSEALLLWLIVVLSGSRAGRVLSSRSAFAFYTSATLLMWALCFGPVVRLTGVEAFHWAPYSWLGVLPGFSGLRVPARFAMLATVCLAAAAGLALNLVLARLRRPAQRAGLLALVALGIAAEGWTRLAVQDPPAASILAAFDAPGGVLELPLRQPPGDMVAVYRSIEHGHPVVNGYSGYEPAYHTVLRLALSRGGGEPLAVLATRGVRHVVVVGGADPGGRWRQLVESLPGVRAVRSSVDQTLYSLPPVPGPSCAPGRTPLPVAAVQANVHAEDARLMVDGDTITRWSTRQPQEPGERLSVDLGQVRAVSAVELALGPYHTDFPGELWLDGAADRQQWLRLWEGRAGGRAVEAVLDDSRRMPLRVCFPEVGIRFLRLRQVATDRTYSWSVAELGVFGPAASSGAGR
ncbi:MAG TPA: hypothetical protein VEQ10_13930 [Vicinamibacteria bacterium]|nr:hypothetical protein [Vicinamibacteria bacterium]